MVFITPPVTGRRRQRRAILLVCHLKNLEEGAKVIDQALAPFAARRLFGAVWHCLAFEPAEVAAEAIGVWPGDDGDGLLAIDISGRGPVIAWGGTVEEERWRQAIARGLDD